MKNTMKKIGLLFAVIIMTVLCAVSVSALDTTGQCGDNVYWTLNNVTGELLISGTGDIYNHSISFPPNCSSSDVKSVIIKNGVTSIGDSAFNRFLNLEKLIIADSVTRIGWGAFYHCSSLKYITIPDSVISIGPSAFYKTAYYENKDNWNDGLLITDGWLIGFETNYVHIPADVKNIADGLFEGGTPAFKWFEVDSNNKYYSSDEYGVLYNKDKTKLISYPGLSKNDTYIIPDTVEEIGTLHSLYLETLVIPHNVKEVFDSNVISYSLKNVYIYNDNINLDSAKYFCYINIDRDKYFEVRDELAKSCEEYAIQCMKFWLGDVTEEELIEYEYKVVVMEDSFSTDKLAPYGTIHGNKGSTAEAYANERGINFKELENHTCTFGDWYTVTQATVFAEGLERRDCEDSKCDNFETRATAKLENAVTKDETTKVEITYTDDNFDKAVDVVVIEDKTTSNIALADEYENFTAYDISLEIDGAKVQPNGKVIVKLPVPAGYNAETIAVYYVDDNGNKTRLNSKIENGYAVFETDHFSEYVIVDESSKIEKPTEPEVPVDPTPDEPAEPDTPEDTEPPAPCSCKCHAGGIKAFFFKLFNFFAKLFNPAKRVCACGVKH